MSAVALQSASANPKASFTTVNEKVDGTGHCQNGNPNVNCNIYAGGQYVWLNGGPVSAALGNGTYFFAVLAPGGQPNPNDGSPKLLSTDTAADRTFSVANGVLTYAGPHTFDSNEIRLAPFKQTPNHGGEYILAICSLANGSPVVPRTCKYDAFKTHEVEETTTIPTLPA
jgi:hypothetical protein